MSLLNKARHLLIGESAENDACQYLIKHKLNLIRKNYRCKLGEIDLIMLDRQTLVFVEVRYRKNSLYGSGAESITIRKQQKIIKAASYYLQQNPKTSQYACRFDVISMSAPNSELNSNSESEPKPTSKNESKIDWIKDAFQA